LDEIYFLYIALLGAERVMCPYMHMQVDIGETDNTKFDSKTTVPNYRNTHIWKKLFWGNRIEKPPTS
jgi:hypothetical protein